MNRFGMFEPGCYIPETLSTNITWIVTCTITMFTHNMIFHIFLIECAATNGTFILLNTVDFLTNFHVPGKRLYMHILCCTSCKQIAWFCVAHVRALFSEPFPLRLYDKFDIPISFSPGVPYAIDELTPSNSIWR